MFRWFQFILYYPVHPFYFQLLGDCLKVLAAVRITVIVMFYYFFNSPGIFPAIRRLSYSLCDQLVWQYPQDEKVFYSYEWKLRMVFWLKVDDPFLSQNLREFHAFRFQGQLLVSAIPFFCLVKFPFLTRFLVGYFPYPVDPVFVFLLCEFAPFSYYAINFVISVTS